MKQPLRAIPAVGKVLDALGETELPRPAVVAVVRRALAALRSAKQIPGFDDVLVTVRSDLAELWDSRIRPVINGTGILIHTNLGRAPLAPEVVETLGAVGANYNNLEYDVAAGERGARAGYLEHNLALLCGAEAATVVNNCAAALVLILKHFTSEGRREVILSRGELIQIGGGFRIPEILEVSGARLREVGTTNQTSLADYAGALGKQTAMILKVHHSNFFMGGFVETTTTEELAALARKKRIPFVEDLGSGAVVATDEIAGVEHEPTPAEVLKRGVDLVCFSGDKLLGGPQAGLVAGRAKWIAGLKREPFFRALRCDKLILSALQTTVDLYLAASVSAAPPTSSSRGNEAQIFVRESRPEADQSLLTSAAPKPGKPAPACAAMPALAMLGASLEKLRTRADKIVASLDGLPLKASVGAGKGEIGGGTLPRSKVASVTVDLWPQTLGLPEFASRLRRGEPPVIGYVSGHRFKLDLRTIFPRQDEEVIRAIHRALGP
jgi:L-seryl-tRNA(Ser) seleniumtransferase